MITLVTKIKLDDKGKLSINFEKFGDKTLGEPTEKEVILADGAIEILKQGFKFALANE